MLSLGIEFSTQSVKMVVLDLEKKQVAYTGSFGYEKAFPQYKTDKGVLPNDSLQIRHTSPYMMIEALDKTFSTLKKENINLADIRGIKVDSMQHCTIYSNKSFGNAITSLQAEKDLLSQLKETISRKTAPIWEDRSTSTEVAILTEALAKHGVENLTGNRAELRFPAVQIMKWAKESPDEYQATFYIMLLSAFLTSILAGKIAPVDTGDGWGTNLNSLDINNPDWNKDIFNLINTYLEQFGLAGNIADKIGHIDHYDAPVGKVNQYFTKKYGVNPNAVVLAGTGDNPATLLGCGGHIVISLGSSYTVNGIINNIVPSISGEYNIFGYTKGNAMALSCITNGGKLHEEFLRKYILKSNDIATSIGKADWDTYHKAAGNSILTENEKLMLPYMQDESVPRCKAGIIRENFNERDVNINIRSLYISQALSLKLHSTHLSNIKSFCIVAGGSKDLFFRQIITDLFNAESFIIENSDFAAPLGCAISGARHILGISYDQAADSFVVKDKKSAIKPIKENVLKTAALLERYRKLEAEHLKKSIF